MPNYLALVKEKEDEQDMHLLAAERGIMSDFTPEAVSAVAGWQSRRRNIY